MNIAVSKSNERIKKLVFAAVCLALAMVLPFFTGQIPKIGKALAPMHIPVLLCGFVSGPMWGLIVGLVAPMLRCHLFATPALASAFTMTFELAAYGFFTGLLYKILPKRTLNIYISLISAMILGRIVAGIVKYIVAVANGNEFIFSAFIAGTVTGAVPGMICQIVLIPIIVIALKKFAVSST